MTWWAAGNARQPQGPQTRELAGRPDRRLLGKSRAGTGPAPSQNIFIGNLVIVHGTGPTSGVFVYNGSPGLGNPPQVAIVPSGVTTDPYGNAITSSKILVQGNVITESGGIFRTSATAPLIQLDGPHDALLVYNAASGLTETIAPAATTDGLGSNVLPGIVTYLETTPFIALQLFGQVIQWYSGTGAGGPWTADRSFIEDVSGTLALSSGTRGGASQASLQLSAGASAAATLGLFSGPVALNNVAAPSNALTLNASIMFASSGHLKTVSAATGGDGNTYGTERLIQRTTATQQFTLASAVAITGLSVPLGVGSYHVRLKVFWVPSGVVGSSHTHQFSFTGTATANVNGQCWQAQAASAVQQGSLNGGTLASNLSSPTHVAFPGWTELEMDITVTVAGTLTPTITLITAGDDITTSAGTFWKIEPL